MLTGAKKAREYNYGEILVNKNYSFKYYITNVFYFNGAGFYPSHGILPIINFQDRLDYQLLIGSWEIIKIDTKRIHLKKSFVTDYKDYTKDSEIIFEKL
jgi:hypothetical protein